uniref:Mediator of RNA polymerase II transcription subunit 9 n=1 Tax=Strongyloides venezuelensis TaxID=75913 RepID=A0A0K0FK62_STRVS
MEVSNPEQSNQKIPQIDPTVHSKTCLSEMHSALTDLMESFEVPNSSNINKKVKTVESRLELFKSSLDQIPDIDHNLLYQEKKIKDLQRCLELKKNLINRLYALPKKLEDIKPGKGIDEIMKKKQQLQNETKT